MVEQDEESGRGMHGGVHLGKKSLADVGQQRVDRLIVTGEGCPDLTGFVGTPADQRLHRFGSERLAACCKAWDETRPNRASVSNMRPSRSNTTARITVPGSTIDRSTKVAVFARILTQPQGTVYSSVAQTTKPRGRGGCAKGFWQAEINSAAPGSERTVTGARSWPIWSAKARFRFRGRSKRKQASALQRGALPVTNPSGRAQRFDTVFL